MAVVWTSRPVADEQRSRHQARHQHGCQPRRRVRTPRASPSRIDVLPLRHFPNLAWFRFTGSKFWKASVLILSVVKRHVTCKLARHLGIHGGSRKRASQNYQGSTQGERCAQCAQHPKAHAGLPGRRRGGAARRDSLAASKRGAVDEREGRSGCGCPTSSNGRATSSATVVATAATAAAWHQCRGLLGASCHRRREAVVES